MPTQILTVGRPYCFAYRSNLKCELLSIVSLLLLATVALIQPAGSQTNTLAPISTPVVHAAYDSFWNYVWIRNDEIVLWRFDKVPTAMRVMQGSTPASPDAEMNRLLQGLFGNFLDPLRRHYVYEIIPSPDRRLLLAVETLSSAGVIGWHIKSIDNLNSKAVSMAKFERQLPVWDRTSNSLVTFSCDKSWANIYKWNVQQDNLAGFNSMVKINDSHLHVITFNDEPELVGITQGGGAIVVDWWRGMSDRVKVFDVDADSGKRKALEYSIPIPRAGKLYELKLSPAGDRFAWYVYVEDTRPALSPGPKQSAAEIRVSAIDGTGMRLIGSQPHRTLAKDEWLAKEAPSLIRWTPDGKRLSYILNDTIWTVPVNVVPATK